MEIQKLQKMDRYFENHPIQNPLVVAIHTAVKGRARYKVNGLYRSKALKKYLEFRLSEKKGIGYISANDYTGNVLVLFNSDFSFNAIAQVLEEVVLEYRTNTNTAQVEAVASREATRMSKPVLTDAIIQREITRTNSQLILISGVVSSLVFCTGLLYRYGLDERILLSIQKLHTPLLDRIMIGITTLGEPTVLLSMCLGLGTGLAYYQRRSEVNTLAIAALGAIGLNYVLKEIFGRARPALWNWIVDVGHHSFPSGHAMMSMVIYGFIGYILGQEFPRWRKQIYALTTILILAIGFSRLYLGVHWPTDVIAGYATGLVWLIACMNLERWQRYLLSARSHFKLPKVLHSYSTRTKPVA
ncbi:MAG: phosphatase PAP2 family protein [Scytonema sp. PMC 1069.18]|nr:phosphatase PAP2 family protein [Scytonema sp. PMC 1069.18]MEC4884446.1 phosphatase PAP2 family protein [Scytonema sp. PMC 1070.18]